MEKSSDSKLVKQGLAAVRVQLEVEDRDIEGLLINRKITNQFVFYASSVPTEVLSWLDKAIQLPDEKAK